MSRTPTKDRVYLALRDGASIRGAARELNLSEKTVREHAADLEQRGVLLRAERGPRGAVGFKKGPKAYPYELSIPDRGGKRRVGSSEGAPKVGVRVHRGGYAFEVRGSVRGVPWERSWNPRTPGGRPYNFRATIDGVGYWLVKEAGAPHRLHVELPDDLLYDPADFARIHADREERARVAAVGFAERFGLKLVSDKGYRYLPLEFAAEIPGLEKFGVPGESFVWVDGSPGDGRLEIETQDAATAAGFLHIEDLPRVKEELTLLRQIVAGLVKNESMIVKALAGSAGKPARALAPDDDPAVA